MTAEELALEVYKLRLEDMSGGGPGAVARMIAKDGDQGETLERRSNSYVPLMKVVLKAIEQGDKPK